MNDDVRKNITDVFDLVLKAWGMANEKYFVIAKLKEPDELMYYGIALNGIDSAKRYLEKIIRIKR